MNDQTALQQAITLYQAGNLAGAAVICRRFVAANPNDYRALHFIGVVEATLGNRDEAERLMRRSLRVKPPSAEFFANYANLLFTMGRHGAALEAFDKALALHPENLDALNMRGVVLAELKRFDHAVDSLNEALRRAPTFADAHYNRGRALQELRRQDEAIASYDRAISLRPDFAAAHLNRGFALRISGRPQEAIAAYERAVAIKPDFAEAWMGRGDVFRVQNRHAEAASDYESALHINPALEGLEGMRLHAKMHVCDWSDYDGECQRLISAVVDGRLASSPFPLLALPSSPSDQLACARAFTAARYPSRRPLWRGERYRHDRIRVAYVSDGFSEHPTSLLMAGVFEHHDRNRFETIAISLQPEFPSPTRNRLQIAFDDFVGAARMSDRQVAELIRAREIDIAVDLTGYTGHIRADIFADRPSPIQVNYLAFPGTMGAEFIDYIVADKVVIPEDQHDAYTERVVYLPETYQPRDRSQTLSDRPMTRQACGLPERGFVFCCFSQNYKITPQIFDIWARLLRTVDGSVLWLLEGNTAAPPNLRREAERRGVPGDRLVFATHIPPGEHLARHRQADLFLDTRPYNAHTTASDALWAGLPVVTSPGETFASRVAASLLEAAMLPELVTRSLDEYAALALALARDPDQLAAIKAKLATNRLVAPLFDTARYTRNLEAAFIEMWSRYQRGDAPASFAVDAIR